MTRSTAAITPNGTFRRSRRKSQTALTKSSANEKTDYSRWRLRDDRGRQTWHYLEEDEQVKKWPQSVADKYHLGMPTVRSQACTSQVRAEILTTARAYPTSIRRKHLYKPPKMACPSSNNFNCLQAIGLANMVARYFSSPASSSLGTSPRLRSQRRTVLKSRITSLRGRTRMVVGGCTLRVRAVSSERR